MTGPMSRHQEQAMRLGLERTRREMLVGGQGPLAKVEAERRLVLEAGRGFERAVREARAEGLSWEQIAEHAPGFTGAFGAEAAKKLFESVSVPGSRFGERHVSWRCGDCDGLVLDSGPYGGHPADSEPGHQKDCGRFGTEIEAYGARLDDTDPDDRLAGGIAPAVTDRMSLWVRPPEIDEPGLDLG